VNTPEEIPLAAPDLGQAEIDAVVGVLERQQLSLGPELVAFEQEAARYAGTADAIAVSSGTAGLHLIVHGLGLGEGDEVITTPFSFIASANCLLFEGVRPIFADIDPATWDLDPAAAEAALNERCRGLLPVHVFGRACPMPAYLDLARRHNLVVIEDSCEAIGTTLDGRMAGSFGRAGVYAFYPNKQMTTGEGGLVVTNDEELADTIRSLRNQGRGSDGTWLGHPRLGWNYRIPDILCALGRVQLARLESFIRARARIFELYAEALADLEEIVCPTSGGPGQRVSWFVYVVSLREGTNRDRRDALLTELTRRGIGCRNYFFPIHLQPFYRERFGLREGMFPVTESVASRTLALPFFNAMKEEQVQRVAQALRESLEATR